MSSRRATSRPVHRASPRTGSPAGRARAPGRPLGGHAHRGVHAQRGVHAPAGRARAAGRARSPGRPPDGHAHRVARRTGTRPRVARWAGTRSWASGIQLPGWRARAPASHAAPDRRALTQRVHVPHSASVQVVRQLSATTTTFVPYSPLIESARACSQGRRAGAAQGGKEGRDRGHVVEPIPRTASTPVRAQGWETLTRRTGAFRPRGQGGHGFAPAGVSRALRRDR